MKRITLIVVMIVLTLGAAKPAAAQNRYIVRSTGGLSSVLNLCNLLKCQVKGGLDGQVGQTFLVTSSDNLLANLLNGTLNLVQSLLGIVSIEADRILPIPQPHLNGIPSGLYDTAPVNYYGSIAWTRQKEARMRLFSASLISPRPILCWRMFTRAGTSIPRKCKIWTSI